MFDFVRIAKRAKKDHDEIYPSFITYSRTSEGNKSSDLMIRGGDFYAVWMENLSRWSTDENDIFNYIDREVESAVNAANLAGGKPAYGHYMWDADSGLVDKWRKFCQRQMRDNYHPLDEKIIFSNDEVTKEDYVTKRLPYPCKKGSTKAWDKLMGVLYSPDELKKLEWAIGAICNGDSRKIQKFIVLYGSAGTGKSTFLNIIQAMFDGYYSSFDAKALGQPSNVFALEPFKDNPLIAIQHDGDLSRIEDNTRLNSIISHEKMTVNEKFKSAYQNRFNSFLFVGTNSPVKITDAKSGLLRRLIDVRPTGNTVDIDTYERLMGQIAFECGAIAYKCREFYEANKKLYNHYIPVEMLSITNDFYDFVLENSSTFEEQNYTTLTQAWKMYKEYCDDANVPYPMKKIIFKQELKNYFEDFNERQVVVGDVRARNVYTGFVLDKFKTISEEPPTKGREMILDKTESLLDKELAECPAQYATDAGTPNSKWNRVRRKLKDIDTSKLHYVKVPLNHIVIDFDIPDPETGEKSYILNLEAASKFPPTYAELSKSGAGIHLHYIYTGDVERLKGKYADHIEVKVFKGDMSLRRQLTKCNDIPIAEIGGGLPLKGDDKLIDFEGIKNEKMLRSMVLKNLDRKYHENTKPSMDFIKKLTDDAYTSGISYDISDLRTKVLAFATSSTHQAQYCIGLCKDIHWMSEDAIEAKESKEPNIIFLDIEVVPNLLLICWKPIGEGKQVARMFNPSPAEVEELFKFDIVGHNVVGYDNHILYARSLGYTNEQIYKVSKNIIKNHDKGFASARKLSYADTLVYPVKRQGLKKWEIELGFPHDEMDINWDEPLDKRHWDRLADYCCNDVLADEAVWNATQTDFTAHKILAVISGGTVNDSTNTLSTKFIFEGNRRPQSEFNYRDMGDISKIDEDVTKKLIAESGLTDLDPEFTKFDSNGMPVFPRYKFEGGKSEYRGEDPKEGGYVYSEPGMYGKVALEDIASMHPSSAHNELLFGEYYTARFWDIVRTRLYIKHGDFEAARKLFDGKLKPYLEDESSAKDLANALKIVINSVYGLTKAHFDNPFRDKRNKDNIVAKRGALFMINLKHEVQKRGFTVAHIKVDSIKIPDATPEIIDFVHRYGELYGYSFEHEATYEKLCLVDKTNYICKDANDGHWSATGDKMRRPYIIKMFTGEEITFKDMCETKAVTTAIYLDMNEDLPDVTAEEKELKKYETKYRKGELSDTTFESESKRLNEIISKGHCYSFVGKVGEFLPVAEGTHGGILVRANDRTGKYGAVEGTKGRRWLEASFVKDNGLEDQIDKDYYIKEQDKVKDAIVVHGDLEWFMSDDPYIGVDYDESGAPIYDDVVPF